MAKAPGVELKETDLSTIVSGDSLTIGAIVIWSKKGPFEERVLVTSTKRFRELFGNEEPGEDGLVGPYQSILWLSNIEGHTAIVGINNCLYTVANIV